MDAATRAVDANEETTMELIELAAAEQLSKWLSTQEATFEACGPKLSPSFQGPSHRMDSPRGHLREINENEFLIFTI
jgi:hypothetical protein